MIVAGICGLFFVVINLILNIIPAIDPFTQTIPTSLIGLLATAFKFFPQDVWALSFGSITFWIGFHIIVGLFMFVKNLIK